MPEIGILCSQSEEERTIMRTVELLALREGSDYSVRVVQEDKREEWKELFCVILSWEERRRAFELAEMLWEEVPGLLIIYVARGTEDIFAALGMPFFHTARSYDLEQDLRAAFRKLGRLKIPLREKLGFTFSGRMLLVPRRDILYLESEHHDIHLHVLKAYGTDFCGKEVLPVAETLSQCEGKLRGMGFARIHKSFLVNMYHIRCLEKETLLLDNGERLYISRRRYPEVKLQFENYIRHLDFLL